MKVGSAALGVFFAGVVLAGFPQRAAAAEDDDVRECLAAHENGQRLRKRGKLIAAAEQFAVCRRSSCPGVVRADCDRWTDEVESGVGGAVIDVRDRSGARRFDTRVAIDGVVVRERLEGRTIPIDPGPHELTVEAGGAQATQTIVVVEGDKRQRFEVVVPTGASSSTPAPVSPPVAAPQAPRRVWPWVTSGVSVVTAVSFGAFAFLGRQEESRLEHSCAPTCSDTSTVKRLYLVADLSLAVSLVAAAVSVVGFTWPASGSSGAAAR